MQNKNSLHSAFLSHRASYTREKYYLKPVANLYLHMDSVTRTSSAVIGLRQQTTHVGNLLTSY